jgi:hypothetical protein
MLGAKVAGGAKLGFSMDHGEGRTKVIGRFPGEASCLSLCWAVLDLVVSHSNGVTFTEVDQQAIDRLSRERAGRSTGEEVILCRAGGRFPAGSGPSTTADSEQELARPLGRTAVRLP